MSSIPSKNDSTKEEALAEGGPRERILQAALKLFVEQGYFNTNVPDISRLSRCSVGSIYHHFLNKEEIADQLYKDGIHQFRTALASAVKDAKDLKSTLRSLVIGFLNFAEQHALLARYLWLARHTEFLNSKKSVPTMVGFDQLGRQLTVSIKNAIRKGEMKELSAEIIWSVLFGLPLSYLRDWLDGYNRETPSSVAPVLADAVWAALQGKSTK